MDGAVSAFDAQTGDVLFTYRDSRPAVHSWAAPGQPEYVPSLDGLLYRIDRVTEEAHVVEGKFITRDQPSILADVLPKTATNAADAVVLTNEESSLLYIDLRAGRVIRETRFADTSPADPLLPSISDNIIVVQRTAVAVRILETATSHELANATLVHTEPRFWAQGRCLTPPNPAMDQFVAYTTEARDRVVVRNLRTGDVVWSKDVAAPVVEAHGLGGVRIAGSHREADAITASVHELPYSPPNPPAPLTRRSVRDVVISDDGNYVYAMKASREAHSLDRYARAGLPSSGGIRNIRRYPVANMNDASALGSADRVLGMTLLPQRMKKVNDVDAEDASHLMTSREVGMAFLILVMVGGFGYLAGSRPRRSKKKRSSNSLAKRQRSASAVDNSFDKNVNTDDESTTVLNVNNEEMFDSDEDHGEYAAREIIPGVPRRTMTHDTAMESSTGSTGSAGAGASVPHRSESGWMSVGCLHVSSKVLGFGSHGTIVYEGKMMPGERKVAVKRLLRQFYESARKEISLLIQLDEASPHVVRYFAMEEDCEFIYLALELCSSSLSECISDRLPPVPSSEYERGPAPSYTMRSLRQLLQGLADLHRVGVVHRDVKPQNVLIGRSAAGVGDIKLADVGLALRLAENRSSYTAVTNAGGGIGTTGWRAPEVLNGGRQTKAVDIFAAGCIVSSMLTGGDHPFGNPIFGRDGNIAAGTPSMASLDALQLPEATDIVRKMIDPVAARRPTAEEALSHPFFWTDGTKLSFLVDISDRLYDLRYDPVRYTENLDRYSLARKHLSDWFVLMDMDLLANLGRGYENKASGLLRVIRNKKNHYSELPASLRRSLGPLPEDKKEGGGETTRGKSDNVEPKNDGCNFLTYFTKKLPHLLMCVYRYALENPALIDQPHFLRYGLKSCGDGERRSFKPTMRSYIGWRNGRAVDGPANVYDGDDDDVDGDTGDLDRFQRRTYHRHKLVEIQERCEGVGVDVKRQLVLADIYQPSAYTRYKKRLVSNEFVDTDFSEEERAKVSPPMEMATPPGFIRLGPRRGFGERGAGAPTPIEAGTTPPGFSRMGGVRRGQVPPSFGTRPNSLFPPTPESIARVGGAGPVQGSGSAIRRSTAAGAIPTVSQFSGEERVVDFSALRRKE